MAVVDAGIPLKDLVCACSATFIEDTTMIGEFIFDGRMYICDYREKNTIINIARHWQTTCTAIN